MHENLENVVDEIMNHISAWPFLQPVKPEETGAIDCYNVIDGPEDLSRITKKLEKLWFHVTKAISIAYDKLMVSHFIKYNGEKNCIAEHAFRIRKILMNKI